MNFANNLVTTIPEGLPRLSQLTELDLSVNALASAPVGTVYDDPFAILMPASYF